MATPKPSETIAQDYPNLDVDCSGMFKVCPVDAGTYNTGKLTGESGGSIHVLGELTIIKQLDLTAQNSGTVLIPKKVTSTDLVIRSAHGSNLNSNNLGATNSCSFSVDDGSTISLYLTLGCDISGTATNGSTANLWIHWTDGPKQVNTSVDGNSVIQVRNWDGAVYG